MKFGWLAAALACALTPGIAHACEPPADLTIQRWSNRTINFVGTARIETVKTGAGDIKYVLANGRADSTRGRPIFGQRITVDRLPVYAQNFMLDGVREMILVPWMVDGGCEPMPWTSSVRWIKPGTRAIYHATLRARSAWINGVPTLDMWPTWPQPYIGGTFSGDKATSPMLTVDELFDIEGLLPDPDILRTDPVRATKLLLQWAAEHPALARRDPAHTLVEDAKDRAGRASKKGGA